MLSTIGRELATNRAAEAIFDPLLFTEKLVSVCVWGGEEEEEEEEGCVCVFVQVSCLV